MEDSSVVLENAWRTYEASVEAGRLAMAATDRFRLNPEHRALAYHTLCEAQAMAYHFAIGNRLDVPHMSSRAWQSYFHTLGGTSPDLFNGAMLVDGRRTYRIRGRFGGLKLMLLQVFSHLLGHSKSKLLADVDFSAFATDSEGNFEATMSAVPHEGNWIPLDPDSRFNFLFLRRFFSDWSIDRGSFEIKLVGEAINYDDCDAELQATRILLAADFLTYLVEKWNIGIYDLYLAKNGGMKNNLAVIPGSSVASEFAGSSATIYIWGIYEIAEDEALIIECDVPDAGYWSFQIMGVWCKPFNFVDRQTDINMDRAAIDDDGVVRCVISLRDPGIANWMDPAGQLEGTITGRAYHARTVPTQPRTRIVKLCDLVKYLPAQTKRVTAAQRTKALEYRRRKYWALCGD